jgi:hypothetical protein
MTKTDDDWQVDDPSWPFTAAELNSIAGRVAYPQREQGLRVLLRAARQYVWQQDFLREHPRKPHAANELRELQDACETLKKAFRGTGAEARAHLAEHERHSPHERAMTVEVLERAIWQFLTATRPGFENAPRGPGDGRRRKDHERALFNMIRRAWELGNDGEARPPYTEFLSDCIEPLKRYGLRPPAKKNLYDKTSPRKKQPD